MPFSVELEEEWLGTETNYGFNVPSKTVQKQGKENCLCRMILMYVCETQ